MNINYKTQAMIRYLFNKKLGAMPLDLDSPIIFLPRSSKVKGVDLKKFNELFFLFSSNYLYPPFFFSFFDFFSLDSLSSVFLVTGFIFTG